MYLYLKYLYRSILYVVFQILLKVYTVLCIYHLMSNFIQGQIDYEIKKEICIYS